jgi:hypothetical protein
MYLAALAVGTLALAIGMLSGLSIFEATRRVKSRNAIATPCEDPARSGSPAF